MTLLRIRPSDPGDLPRLFDIWSDAVDATHHFLKAAHRAEIAALVRDVYLPSRPFAVAAGESDRPLGFMGLAAGHIEALFVDPGWHGRGIGRALVRHAQAQAPVLTVDVNEENAGAVRFYERLGFERLGRSALDDAGRPYPLLHLRLAA